MVLILNKVLKGFLLLNCLYLFFTGLSALSGSDATMVSGSWEGVVLLLMFAGMAIVVSEIRLRSVALWAALALVALGYFLYYLLYFLPRVPDLAEAERLLGWSLAAFACLPAVIAFGARMVGSAGTSRRATNRR